MLKLSDKKQVKEKIPTRLILAKNNHFMRLKNKKHEMNNHKTWWVAILYILLKLKPSTKGIKRQQYEAILQLDLEMSKKVDLELVSNWKTLTLNKRTKHGLLIFSYNIIYHHEVETLRNNFINQDLVLVFLLISPNLGPQ